MKLIYFLAGLKYTNAQTPCEAGLSREVDASGEPYEDGSTGEKCFPPVDHAAVYACNNDDGAMELTFFITVNILITFFSKKVQFSNFKL